MRFKKIISIIMSAVITAASTSEFSYLPLKCYKLNAIAEIDNDEAYNTWQEAYREILDIYKYSEEYRSYENYKSQASAYELYDVDNNGIPELFISEGKFYAATTTVYTFIKGRCFKLIEQNDTDGTLYLLSNSNYIIDKNSYSGKTKLSIYALNNNELTLVESFYDNSYQYSSSENNISYIHNGVAVTKNTYKSAKDKYDKLNYQSVGRAKSFEDLNCEVENICYNYYFDYYEAFCIDYDEDSNIDISSISISNTINGLPVKKIGDVFLGSLEVKELNIPSNIEYLTDYSLNSYYLEKINVDASNKYYSSKDGVLYNKNMTTLIKFPNEKNASSYIFLNSVTRIGEDAFYNCNQVSNITIPETVNIIEYSAFKNCENLKSITIKNPDCIIEDYDTAETICNLYLRSMKKADYPGVIQGYDGSTAQKYAEKYDRKFTSLGANPKLTTTTTSTTTTKKVTTTSTTTTRITTTTLPVRKINVTMWGDANVDGKINVADVICIRHMIVDMDMFIADGTLIFNKDQSRVNADVVSPQDITGAAINPENVKITGADADRIINYIISGSFNMTKAVTPINT